MAKPNKVLYCEGADNIVNEYQLLHSRALYLVLSINMEITNIDYSTKNIPVPFKDEYEIQLVSKVENLIKRMQWKALEYLGKLNDSAKENSAFFLIN